MRDAASKVRSAVRTPRAAAVAGVAFSILFTLAFTLVRLAVPTDVAAGDEWLDSDTQRQRVGIALRLIPFAGISFLWFIGVVRDRIGHQEDRFYASVFLGSGLLFIAVFFAAGATATALIETEELRTQSPEVWRYGRHVSMTLLTTFALRMAAVFVLSTTTITRKLDGWPEWLTMTGFATALALFVGADLWPWIALAFPTWVMLFSIHILVAVHRSDVL